MQSVESGEWDIFVEKRGVFEVVALSSAFSHMVGRIKALMGRIMEDQKALRECELRMLYEQINLISCIIHWIRWCGSPKAATRKAS